jgi:hypothetical protein
MISPQHFQNCSPAVSRDDCDQHNKHY